jgi:ABC-type Zn2+ transport system substrate-binding protein/surface adhesin
MLWHGLYLEAQMEELLQKLARRQKVVAVAETLPKDVLIAHDDYAGRFDPHVWMNPNAVVARRRHHPRRAHRSKTRERSSFPRERRAPSFRAV